MAAKTDEEEEEQKEGEEEDKSSKRKKRSCEVEQDKKGKLRPIVIDGSNVAMLHGKNHKFSVRGKERPLLPLLSLLFCRSQDCHRVLREARPH